MATTYTAKDITVLEGLEPVRKRPGMYIGGVSAAGLHHLVWEVLDNSIDEAMNGYASNISVTLHEDGSSITIADDGRGIPVDKHPKSKTSALEVIFSTLHAGVKIVFEDEAKKDRVVFQHTEGLADYLKKILAERSALPVHEIPFSLSRESDESGIRLDVALQWTQSTDEHVRSYVNGIPTESGGTHENGFRAGLGKAVRNYIDTHSLSPKGVTLTAEDIREGLIAVLSVFVPEPQFQGQTKDRLNNPEVMSAVDSHIRPAREHSLNTNISVAESIVARIILSARAREA